MFVNETMRSSVKNSYVITYLRISWDADIVCHLDLFLDDNLDEKNESTLNNNIDDQFFIFDVCEWNNEKLSDKHVCDNPPLVLVGRYHPLSPFSFPGW